MASAASRMSVGKTCVYVPMVVGQGHQGSGRPVQLLAPAGSERETERLVLTPEEPGDAGVVDRAAQQPK